MNRLDFLKTSTLAVAAIAVGLPTITEASPANRFGNKEIAWMKAVATQGMFTTRIYETCVIYKCSANIDPTKEHYDNVTRIGIKWDAIIEIADIYRTGSEDIIKVQFKSAQERDAVLLKVFGIKYTSDCIATTYYPKADKFEFFKDISFTNSLKPFNT